MILGKTVEFTVKGKPGSYAALALADKDTGAKPICGHKLRLGADRKVVAAVEIPASGTATISVDTPIEGDLIGLCLYFEAAVWSKPDFSDVEIANVVPSERQESAPNGVLIAADTIVKKKGIKIGSGQHFSALDILHPRNRNGLRKALMKVLLIPLDDRPITYSYPQLVAKAAGIVPIVPPRTLLGSLSEAAKVEALNTWVDAAIARERPSALLLSRYDFVRWFDQLAP